MGVSGYRLVYSTTEGSCFFTRLTPFFLTNFLVLLQVIEPGVIPEVPIWFPEARLNYAENNLQRTDDAVACTEGGEDGTVRNYTYRQLRELVRKMAQAMRGHGLTRGDRVSGKPYLPHHQTGFKFEIKPSSTTP